MESEIIRITTSKAKQASIIAAQKLVFRFKFQPHIGFLGIGEGVKVCSLIAPPSNIWAKLSVLPVSCAYFSLEHE